MKISIFGMGYVGVVSAGCLLRDGHHVVGVDPVESKVRDLNEGRSPIQEAGVAKMLAAGRRDGRLSASTAPADGLADCDMVWVCVGTPSSPSGAIDLRYVENCLRDIGTFLRGNENRPLIVLRSTVLPGSTRGKVIPVLEQAGGLSVGRDVHLVFHPEFLREGSAVHDFDNPPKIVVGEAHPGGADRLFELYESYEGPRFRTELEVAEMVKYSDNTFHAMKITFANEMGALARAVGADARAVADIFCADTKLNISAAYLRPGFAFGGSCLPKDLRAILHFARVRSVATPMLEGMGESNRTQIENFVSRVLSTRPTTVGVIGLAFKPGTDDMRESPHVAVAKRLIGEGIRLRIWDPGVDPNRLVGSNKAAVQTALGHLESLLVPESDALNDCDLILINHPAVDAAQVRAWLQSGIRVIDLTGIPGVESDAGEYEGIAW